MIWDGVNPAVTKVYRDNDAIEEYKRMLLYVDQWLQKEDYKLMVNLEINIHRVTEGNFVLRHMSRTYRVITPSRRKKKWFQKKDKELYAIDYDAEIVMDDGWDHKKHDYGVEFIVHLDGIAGVYSGDAIIKSPSYIKDDELNGYGGLISLGYGPQDGHMMYRFQMNSIEPAIW